MDADLQVDTALQVDTVALGACVPSLLDLGTEVTTRSARAPAAVTVPRWAASDAAAALAGATRTALTDLAASVTATGQAVAAAVAGYEAADERAVARLRAFR